MVKLIKNKKFFLFFCGFLLAFLFLAKSSSLAQTPTICPVKPSGLRHYINPDWGILWTNNRLEATSGYVHKTSGASPATGICFSNFIALGNSWIAEYSWKMNTRARFCGCDNVGFKAYNQKPGCPEVESDEIKINFGGCQCAKADFNYDNAVNATDQNTFNSLYASCHDCTPWTCDWLTCGKADLTRDGNIGIEDVAFISGCYSSTFCWCGTRPADDTPAYTCEGQYYGQSQCKTKTVSLPQGACVLDPKWGTIDPKNPSSSTNTWKWTYCYPKGQIPVSISLAPTSSAQKICEGTYFGQSQCKAKVTPKPGYSCQLNPAWPINSANLSDPINRWKWSYCKN